LLDAANMVGVLLASFLLPYIARLWSEKKDIGNIILTSRHFLMTFSIAIVCAAFFLAPWIQGILYHHDDLDAIKVMQWCLPALIGYSLVQIYGTVLTATGHIISFCYITFIAVLINVILNLLMISSLGAKGSCFAALASQGFCGLAVMYYAWEKSIVNIHFRSIIIYIFTVMALSAFLYWGTDWQINPLWLLAGTAMISLAIMFASGFLQLKKWMDSLRKTEL
ncbi:MAG TPA: polysaccharide biosynthesis C-terminal domain-containing protein, partial [Chitinophagaceae bacterium]|nr:polysaccharide biosynthesis C-terminal domain-containing protein [Chitinophagaceae bacterium]